MKKKLNLAISAFLTLTNLTKQIVHCKIGYYFFEID